MLEQDFAQVPSHILANPYLKDSEKTILGLFELFRFRKTYISDYRFINLTNKVLADFTGKTPDQTLRIIHSLMINEHISTHYKIKLKRKTMNEPLQIEVDFIYLLNKITIEDHKADSIDYLERKAIEKIIDNSKHFKVFSAAQLMKEAKTKDYSELVRAIIDIDTRENIKNAIAFLKSGFKKGKYIYSNLKLKSVAVPDKKMKNNQVYVIDICDLRKLKEQKTERCKIHLLKTKVNEKEVAVLYYATEKGRERSIFNLLTEINIPFEVMSYENKEKLISKLNISIAS